MDHTVDRICRGENGGSVQLGLHPVFQMQPRRIRPADVQPVGGVGQRWAREGGSGARSTEAPASISSAMDFMPTHSPE